LRIALLRVCVPRDGDQFCAGAAVDAEREAVTSAQVEQLQTFARELYGGHPAALALLESSVHGATDEERFRAAAALTALDPANEVTAVQRIALARNERGAERLLRAVPPRVDAGAGLDPDRPHAEKEKTDGPRFYIESGPAFLAETDPEEEHIIRELVPAGRTILKHGEPRARKSWAAIETAVAAATGTLAFGLERFAVPAAVPVLYSSQEDGRRDVRARLCRILAGRGLTTAPAELFLSVHAGINLESPEWQDTLMRDVQALGIRYVIFDPARRFSPNADKGPAEVREVTGFMRRLAVETGAAVETVHHDVKPGREADTRRRGHKASGGDWFAASDCPIHLEPAGRDRTLVVPEDFTFGADPASFSFRIEEDEAKTWARLVAEDVAAEEVGAIALHERVLDFLRNNPGSTGNAVARGVRGGKEAILGALRAMSEGNQIDSVEERRGVKWFVRGAP